MIWDFGFYKSSLYLIYLLYSPLMISFTYLFSFIFYSESSRKNAIIIFNCIGGALPSSVI